MSEISQTALDSAATLDDLAILRRIADGDLGSFDVFVDRHKDRVLRYLAARTADRHTAEDLAQEVFLRVFRAARKGGPDGSRRTLTPWLFAIARNCANDYHRSRQRKPLTLASDTPIDPAGHDGIERLDDAHSDPSEIAAKADLLQQARHLLTELPQSQQEVVSLKTIGQLTFAQIAEVLDCPLATVKSRMRYGLASIHALLEADRRCK